jgi:hypothetical protein
VNVFEQQNHNKVQEGHQSGGSGSGRDYRMFDNEIVKYVIEFKWMTYIQSMVWYECLMLMTMSVCYLGNALIFEQFMISCIFFPLFYFLFWVIVIVSIGIIEYVWKYFQFIKGWSYLISMLYYFDGHSGSICDIFLETRCTTDLFPFPTKETKASMTSNSNNNAMSGSIHDRSTTPMNERDPFRDIMNLSTASKEKVAGYWMNAFKS